MNEFEKWWDRVCEHGNLDFPMHLRMPFDIGESTWTAAQQAIARILEERAVELAGQLSFTTSTAKELRNLAARIQAGTTTGGEK